LFEKEIKLKKQTDAKYRGSYCQKRTRDAHTGRVVKDIFVVFVGSAEVSEI